ncbi:MAG TPA: glutamate 5-kinase [Polyangiaceae bacterium]|nr:glutamate 5-kinase [Polyangiaceae bacterium]
MHARDELTKARRLVVKVGSRSLATDHELIPRLARELAAVMATKRQVVLVSSGAIALGMHRLGYPSRPKETRRLQAAAAAGQSVLMRRYDEAFGAVGVTTAQVLLTHSDLAERDRMNNAREALGELLDTGALPIINENDVVSTEELHFGDNDQLAALVAPLVGADLLVLLTDVEGVLDEAGERIGVMGDNDTIGRVASSGQRVGSGGIQSKIDAARKGCRAGAGAIIAAAGRAGALGDILDGADVGTFFPAIGAPLRARQSWIMFTLRPQGSIVLDTGAVAAVRTGKASVLPVGVLGVRGEFAVGDAVVLVGPDGQEVARGLARLGALDAARAAGKKGPLLEAILGSGKTDAVIVHKDDLVVSG